jgi:hypothetical protein
MIPKRLDDCAEEFPNLLEFTSNVIDKLKPPFPHVFCVQGFQVNNRKLTHLKVSCHFVLEDPRPLPGYFINLTNFSTNQTKFPIKLDRNIFERK